VDANEASGNFRVTVLFLIVALAVLGIDQQQEPASHEERIELAGATSLHMELDHCELIYIQEDPRDQDVRFFDERVSAEQYLVVHVTQHDNINIVADVTGINLENFDIRVENLVLPQYARYEGYLCVMEYHYPKGEVMPATTVTLTGRHVSTISAGRCEVCYISTRSDMPKGCIQPYPFVADTDDGTCSARPVWGANPLVIQTEEGQTTPAVIGMRNAELTDLNITVLGGGFISLTDVAIAGTADVHSASGSVNIELTHAARAEAENDEGRICITDASYFIESEEVEVVASNQTNTTEVAEVDTAVVGDDPLAVLLAMLLGGSDVAATTEEVTADEDPEQVIDESEVEDLGRRLQDALEVARLEQQHAVDEEAQPARKEATEQYFRSALQNLGQRETQLLQNLGQADRVRLLQEAVGDGAGGEAFNASNVTAVSTGFYNISNLTDTGPVYLDPSELPLIKVSAKGVVSIRARDSKAYEHYIDHMSYFNELYGAKISDTDIGRLKTALTSTEPVADIIDIRLWGRGSPYGSWRWHRSSLYTGYSAGFLAIGSLGLLGPRTFAMDISLERSFCSIDDSEAGRADFGTITEGTEIALLKLHAVLAREISKATVELDDRSYSGLPEDATPIGFKTWGADRFGVVTVKVNPRAGVKYLSVLTYGTPDTKSMAQGVYYLNFLVVAVMGGLVARMLMSSWNSWCHSHLQVWGSSYFGPRWRSKRRYNRVKEQAGFFFMVEFFVAYPRQRAGLSVRMKSVVVDLCAILMPAMPICAVLWVSRHEYFGPMYLFNGFGAMMAMFQTVFGLIYLTSYYLGLRWSLRAKLWKPFRFFLVVNTVVATMLICNVYFFLIIGSVLRPQIVLPAATGLASLTAHGVLASRRISALSAALPSEATRASATSAAANAALEALEEGLQDWYRRRAVRDAATTLGPLRLLELSGDALRRALHIEMLWAALVVGLSGPIAISHRAYGYHLGAVEGAIASVIIGAVGMALQLARPLADGGLPGQQAKWEAAVSRAAADEEARIADVEAKMEEEALAHGDLGETDDSSGSDLYSSDEEDDDDGTGGRSSGMQQSTARKRKVVPEERYA
jgi:hypothetical protein